MKNTIKLKANRWIAAIQRLAAIQQIAAIQRIAALIVLVMAVAFPVFAGGSRDQAKPKPAPTPAAAPASTLIITGLEAYNGMFIMVKSDFRDPEGFQAGGRIVERVSPFHGGTEQAVEGVRIANGRASLTVWSSGFGEIGDLFTASEEKDEISIMIWSGEDGIWEWSSRDDDITKVFAEGRMLEFTNGGVTFNGSDLPPHDPNKWD